MADVFLPIPAIGLPEEESNLAPNGVFEGAPNPIEEGIDLGPPTTDGLENDSLETPGGGDVRLLTVEMDEGNVEACMGVGPLGTRLVVIGRAWTAGKDG